MSIVSTTDQPFQSAPGTAALLEVAVTSERDVPGADEGGAGRLFLVADVDSGGLSPEPSLVSSVCRETEVPVRVMLRLNVQGNGAVTYPSIDDVTLNGTELGSCLKSSARMMVFPKFVGDALHVDVPLVLAGR